MTEYALYDHQTSMDNLRNATEANTKTVDFLASSLEDFQSALDSLTASMNNLADNLADLLSERMKKR